MPHPRPHPLALFSLVPENERAKDVVAHSANEPTTSGVSSAWARVTALYYDCVVIVGYPEKVTKERLYYTSTIVVNSEGNTVANYRKTVLYYCDENSVLEGPNGFIDSEVLGLGNVTMGGWKWIDKPSNAHELAHHILDKKPNLVILAMAWLTRQGAKSYVRQAKEPDMETLSY
jgi:protein N-terminal amidase